MAHPDRTRGVTVEELHVNDHLLCELPIIFARTNKADREGVLTYRHYEDGRKTLTISGDAIQELDRRDRRGPVPR